MAEYEDSPFIIGLAVFFRVFKYVVTVGLSLGYIIAIAHCIYSCIQARNHIVNRVAPINVPMGNIPQVPQATQECPVVS